MLQRSECFFIRGSLSNKYDQREQMHVGNSELFMRILRVRIKADLIDSSSISDNEQQTLYFTIIEMKFQPGLETFFFIFFLSRD